MLYTQKHKTTGNIEFLQLYHMLQADWFLMASDKEGSCEYIE